MLKYGKEQIGKDKMIQRIYCIFLSVSCFAGGGKMKTILTLLIQKRISAISECDYEKILFETTKKLEDEGWEVNLESEDEDFDDEMPE